jgi:hypothetical protein
LRAESLNWSKTHLGLDPSVNWSVTTTLSNETVVFGEFVKPMSPLRALSSENVVANLSLIKTVYVEPFRLTAILFILASRYGHGIPVAVVASGGKT